MTFLIENWIEMQWKLCECLLNIFSTSNRDSSRKQIWTKFPQRQKIIFQQLQTWEHKTSAMGSEREANGKLLSKQEFSILFCLRCVAAFVFRADEILLEEEISRKFFWWSFFLFEGRRWQEALINVFMKDFGVEISADLFFASVMLKSLRWEIVKTWSFF